MDYKGQDIAPQALPQMPIMMKVLHTTVFHDMKEDAHHLC
jgi:hypothetical protein